MGARAYRYLSLYDPAPSSVIVEIGSERGEGSTRFLADYAARHRLMFHTADIDPDVHAVAKRLAPCAWNTTGAEMLRTISGRIGVAYLDGFDWIPDGLETEPWIADQRARYHALGHEMTNENSRAEHLEEARLVAERAADRCAVICDDTWHNGSWDGKGGLAVPHLIQQGFEVVDVGERAESSLGYVVLRR
jgi:hypothetical protein